MIRDATGRVRIEMSVDEEGTAFLRMLDATGEERSRLSVREDGRSSLVMEDGKRPHLRLQMIPGIESQILLANSTGSPRVELIASQPDKSYGVFLANAGAKLSGGLVVSKGDGGWPSLVLVGRGGQEEVVATAGSAEEGGGLVIRDSSGKVLFKVP